MNISKHDSCLAMGRKKINKGRVNKNGVQQTGAAAHFLYVSLQKVCRLPLKLRTKYWPLHKQKHRDIVTFFGATVPQWVRAFLFTRFLDHTQRRTTVSRTPSSSHRPLPDNTHNRHSSTPRWNSNPQSQQASGRRPKPYRLRGYWDRLNVILSKNEHGTSFARKGLLISTFVCRVIIVN
jgi:hypothetical protein